MEDAIRDAHLIIETAADELETKLELFTIFDKFAKPNAIFRHDQCGAPNRRDCRRDFVHRSLHDLAIRAAENPRHLTIIPGPQTSRETIRACTEFAQQLKIQLDPPPSNSDAPQGTNNRKA